MPCFGRETTHACRLRESGVGAEAAYAACFDENGNGAERVLMRELVAGDRVLTTVAGAPKTTRVLLTEHRAEPHLADVLTVHHSGGMITLTPDHVILVDGVFASARTVHLGSTLTGVHGENFTVSRVEAGRAGIINPITTTGTVLAAGEHGKPLLASTYGEWIADWLLGATVWPLPFSCASTLAFLFPASVQAYHDEWVEPVFLRGAAGLKATKRGVPSAVVALIVAAFDVALAVGLAAFCVVANPTTAVLAVAAAAAAVLSQRRAKFPA